MHYVTPLQLLASFFSVLGVITMIQQFRGKSLNNSTRLGLAVAFITCTLMAIV